MLATSCLNTQAWSRAAALLQDDPERETDPALQMAYGLALLRSGRAAEAERILAPLAAAQADSAELRGLLLEAARAAEASHPPRAKP
jgi:predicted Zn-dependent protease